MAADAAFAADPASTHHYELSGSSSLSLDAPVLRTGSLRLKATLSGAATHAGPVIQSDARFALSATLGATALVCYNDTIFRDDFDGDGF